MARRRKGMAGEKNLTNGPGKLAQALGLGWDQNRLPVWKKPLTILASERNGLIGVTTRIGLTEGSDLLLRFYLKDNPYVSVKPGQDRPSPGMKKKLKGKKVEKAKR